MAFRKNGFTLLELLIVIAIIGLLAAVVLSFLGPSRDRGANSGIKKNMMEARSQAEMFYVNQNKSYEDVCLQTNPDGIWRQVQAAKKDYAGNPKALAYDDATPSTGTTEECHDSVTGYAAWVPLRGSTNASPIGWCIDSQNTSKMVNLVLTGGATQCP